METREELTPDELRRLLSYDPLTGEFRWLVKRSGVRHGAVAGSPAPQGIRIRIHRLEFYAHRLAWLYMHGVWPADVIDHINGNPLDNRIENLREATQAQNLGNCKKRVDNTSGHKGVATVWNGSWRATIRGRHLGTFATKEQAQTAYANAAEREFGAFAKVV